MGKMDWEAAFKMDLKNKQYFHYQSSQEKAFPRGSSKSKDMTKTLVNTSMLGVL